MALRDLGPVPGAPDAKAFRREPSYDPTEYAFDLVVKRPDGTQVSISISYDALASLGIHSDQQREWLLKLAAAEAKLVHPPLPAPTGPSGTPPSRP